MKKKVMNKSIVFIIGFFIFYTAYYYFVDGSDFSSKRVTFTAIVSILAGVTWGIIYYQILKSKKRVNQIN